MIPVAVGVFLGAGLGRLLYLRHVKSVYAWWSPLYRFKQFVALCMTLFELCVFIEAVASERAGFRAFSAAFLVLGGILAVVFQFWEHKKGNRIPALLTLYWTMLTIIDTARLRTLILHQEHGIGESYEFIVFMVHLLFVLALLCLSCIVEPASTESVSSRPRFMALFVPFADL